MKQILIAFLFASALLFAGCVSQPQQQAAGEGAMMEKDSGEASQDSGAMMDKGTGPAENEGGTMMPKEDNGSVMNESKEQGAMMKSSASYVPYDAAAYQKARAEGKVVYLEFYASWCPDCRAYEPRVDEAFARMAQDSKYDGIAGFKVQFDTQEDLKREFGIVGQHTHVIIGKDGKVAVKSREVWSLDDLVSRLEQQL